MRKICALVVLMLGCVAMPATAMYENGQNLYTDLKRFDTRNANEPDLERDVAIAMAFGYIKGVVDSFDGQFFCSPQSVTVGQLSQTVLNYLSQHPEYWHKNASVSVRFALSDQWPCAKK